MVKRNRTIVLLLICSMLFVMTGCGNQIPEMTEEENALVTEYAAGLLLQYHSDYTGKLVDTSVKPEEEQVFIEETATDNSEQQDDAEGAVSENSTDVTDTVSDNSISSAQEAKLTIAQVVGAEGMDITCGSYMLCDSYPPSESDMSVENMLFAMRASAGNKLLVVNIHISNPTGNDMTLNTIAMTDLKCKLIINGEKKQNAYVSMLDNDFLLLDQVIAAGESVDTVVVTEMPEEEANQIASVALTLQREELSATVDLHP